MTERKRDDDAFRRGDEAGRGEKEKGREAEVKMKAGEGGGMIKR